MLKEQILTILQEHKGEFISGQMLCDKLGVTRTSIWKNILALKNEGYVIDAITRRGYRLTDASYTYNEFEIKKELKKVGLQIDVLYKKVVDSTNTWAFEESTNYNELLLVANEQSLGKGRMGRAWVSPPECGIWMSYLMKPNIHVENASMITLIFALSVAHAIQDMFQCNVEIKWPNDIVYMGKKICGILTEMRSDTDGIRALVCGIGINANIEIFPKELEEMATSILKSFGVRVDRVKLISRIMENFKTYFDEFLKTEDLSELKEEYEELLVNKEKEVFIMENNTRKKVLCKGINSRGELIVEDEEQLQRCIRSGEVSVRGIYGYV